MSNPFTLRIAQREDFCNRKKELADLLAYARNSNNVVLFSPRRYGKSSLIKQVFDILQKDNFMTVYVDLFPISSEQHFITRFSNAVLKGIGRKADPRSFIDKVGSIFKRIVPNIEVKPDGVNISAKIDNTASTDLLLDDLMEGLYIYTEKKKQKICVALDEFQEITELPESKKIEGILRSHIQTQKGVAYSYIGSRRRILHDMFNDKNRPFYKSAYNYMLKEIPKQDFIPYIENKFNKTNKACPEIAAGNIYDSVRGYPYYVQKLASIVWDMTTKSCTTNTVLQAYNALLEIETPDFEGIWSGLSLIQKSVLRAIAKTPTPSPYSREFLELHRLSLGGTQRAMHALLSKDLIEKDSENKYRVTDPVLGAWINIE
ncbi:MAG: ATP-binding protein [Nitrospirota bacterium]